MDEFAIISTRLLAALAAGGIIGLERAFHGRPAGFRTHSLVCTSSTLLMLLTVFQWELLADVPLDTLRVDPTRMGQGIMTGIGFLGAGVIMKERLSIRGLTTAAAIWMTASIGIVIGMGMFTAAALATLLTLIILSLFGWLEKWLPTQRYAHIAIRTGRGNPLSRQDITALLIRHDITSTVPSYYQEDQGRSIRYDFTARSIRPENFEKLADTLGGIEQISEFSVIPSGEQVVRGPARNQP